MKNYESYLKVVLLSTLTEAKPLHRISEEWFNSKATLFQPHIYKEIKKLVEKKMIVLEKRRYKATDKYLKMQIASILLSEKTQLFNKYKKQLEHFYISLGEYTHQVYLNFDVIKLMTKLDRHQAFDLDVGWLLQLPFILRYLEEKEDSGMFSNFVRIMKLGEYIKLIRKLELRYAYILEERNWVNELVTTIQKIIELFPKLATKTEPSFRINMEKIKVFTETQSIK
ncbi:hypothetical protein CL620_03375 [archaeon]|nr:hypothetical protein [archaeon]|tara:strand:- start:334 stop:1011 length:678 start_codon:yes stop_codon:yes gene_type:complete